MASDPPDDAAVPGGGIDAAAIGAGPDLNSASAVAVPPGVPGELLSETLQDSYEVIAPAAVGSPGASDEPSKKGAEEAGAELMVEATNSGGDGGGQDTEEVAEVSSRGNEVSLPADTNFEQELGFEEDKRDAANISDSEDASHGADEEKTVEEGDSAIPGIGTNVDMHEAGASSGGDMQVGEQEVHKKRGRGRGWPRLSDAEKSQPISKKKKSRGSESSQAKRKARPSSSAVKNTRSDSQVEDKGVPTREEQTSSKRKRARPLRYTEEGLELAKQSKDESYFVMGKSASSKGRRGRPKLSKGENSESSDILEEEDAQVGEQSSSSRRTRGRPRRLALDIVHETRYIYPFQDETKDGFAVSDLVWGKVRSHPWWPGQVFDSSDASDAALTIQKKDRVLVAYFGDRSFAWCDESQLKPFQKNFTQMEKQNFSYAFVTAVNNSLPELSRRIELGMVCDCVMSEAYADLKDKKVENAGIREGTLSSNIDKPWITNHFEPARLIEYFQSLAKAPHNGADRLDLVIAKAQLKAFRRSKGHPEVPGFVLGGELEDDDADLLSEEENSVNGKNDPSTPVPHEKQKSGGRDGSSMKGKHVGGKRQKEISELMDEEVDDELATVEEKNQPGLQLSAHSSVKNMKVVDSDNFLSGSETKSPSYSGKKGSKVGDRVCRVAGMMSGSAPSILKPNGETVKTIELNGDSFIGPSAPSEFLSQLRLIALHPPEAHSFPPSVICFFSDFKYWMVSSSSKDVKDWEIVRSDRLNRKLTNLELDCQEPDIIQDCYWSDIIISEEPNPDTDKGKGRSQIQTSENNKKQENESVLSNPVDSIPVIEESSKEDGSTTASVAKEVEDGFDVPVCHSHDKIDDFRPTELAIKFPGLDALPTVIDLVSIFGSYGPFREGEVEVVEDAKLAKVVFKRRSDAEAAYKHAGMKNIFGQIAVSYKLRDFDSASKVYPNVDEDDAGLAVDNMRVHEDGSSI